MVVCVCVCAYACMFALCVVMCVMVLLLCGMYTSPPSFLSPSSSVLLRALLINLWLRSAFVTRAPSPGLSRPFLCTPHVLLFFTELCFPRPYLSVSAVRPVQRKV